MPDSPVRVMFFCHISPQVRVRAAENDHEINYQRLSCDWGNSNIEIISRTFSRWEVCKLFFLFEASALQKI